MSCADEKNKKMSLHLEGMLGGVVASCFIAVVAVVVVMRRHQQHRRDVVSRRLVARLQEGGRGMRLVGLAGVPGSGKTTLAAEVQRHAAEVGLRVVVLSMDGYHFRRSELDAMENPEEMHRRRGAPFTFDAERFVRDMMRIKALTTTTTLTFPSFDHSVGDPVEDDIRVTFEVGSGCEPMLVIVEGNYLAYDVPPWNELSRRKIFDEIWFLNTSIKTATERLVKRHCKAWGWDEERARERVAMNDLLNMQLIVEHRVPVGLIIPEE